MSGLKVESVDTAEAYDRLLANLDDAGMGLFDFLTLVETACHMSCIRDWTDDRWIALGEAERYLFLLGGREGVLDARATRAGWGQTA